MLLLSPCGLGGPVDPGGPCSGSYFPPQLASKILDWIVPDGAIGAVVGAGAIVAGLLFAIWAVGRVAGFFGNHAPGASRGVGVVDDSADDLVLDENGELHEVGRDALGLAIYEGQNYFWVSDGAGGYVFYDPDRDPDIDPHTGEVRDFDAGADAEEDAENTESVDGWENDLADEMDVSGPAYDDALQDEEDDDDGGPGAARNYGYGR